MSKETSLDTLTEDVVTIFNAYQKTGTKPWTYETASQDLIYQVGSLTKAIMQLNNARHAEGKSETEIRATIADELADILAEVLFIAHELDISMEDAWEKMKASDQKKITERSSHA